MIRDLFFFADRHTIGGSIGMAKRPLKEADITLKRKMIGDELKRRRTFMKLTQQELADAAGVEKRTIAMIERGGEGYDIDAFIRCCTILQATILPVGFDVVIPDSVTKRKPFDVV